jgi:hypothetical protein
MDINHIQLPANLIAELYTSSLIDTGEPATKATVKAAKPGTESAATGFRSLGENKRNVLIVVNYADAVHIPDGALQFLTNMLSACKLSLADVAIVNIHQQSTSYKELLQEYKSRIALLFDTEPAGFGLPMSFPFFQIQPFAGCSFLYAPSLMELENDKMQKSKLWVCLKRLFNV